MLGSQIDQILNTLTHEQQRVIDASWDGSAFDNEKHNSAIDTQKSNNSTSIVGEDINILQLIKVADQGIAAQSLE